MANLLSKFRAMVNARVRGPRRYKRKPIDESGPEPEVIEAPARSQKLPEVTEAPQAKSTATPAQATATPARRPFTRVKEPGADKEQADALEEERVADLLKDKRP